MRRTSLTSRHILMKSCRSINESVCLFACVCWLCRWNLVVIIQMSPHQSVQHACCKSLPLHCRHFTYHYFYDYKKLDCQKLTICGVIRRLDQHRLCWKRKLSCYHLLQVSGKSSKADWCHWQHHEMKIRKFLIATDLFVQRPFTSMYFSSSCNTSASTMTVPVMCDSDRVLYVMKKHSRLPWRQPVQCLWWKLKTLELKSIVCIM